MLLELARWLAHDIRGFNVFNYITVARCASDLNGIGYFLYSRPQCDS